MAAKPTNLNKRFLPRAGVIAAILAATLALPVLGASAAHADSGKGESGEVHLTWLKTVQYRNLDTADARHRQVLLKKVEREARKLCDRSDMVRSDRRACQETLVSNAMNSVSEPVRGALALAQAERNGVAQAMR